MMRFRNTINDITSKAFNIMIIYSVACTVSKEIAEDWKKLFLEKHLNDVVNTGCFKSWTFRKVISQVEVDTVTFVSEYLCENQETLDHYNQNFAAKLKAEVGELFGGKYTCKRTLFEVIKN